LFVSGRSGGNGGIKGLSLEKAAVIKESFNRNGGMFLDST
jgi:hypothetical protein